MEIEIKVNKLILKHLLEYGRTRMGKMSDKIKTFVASRFSGGRSVLCSSLFAALQHFGRHIVLNTNFAD